jgi:spore germination protein YaaH
MAYDYHWASSGPGPIAPVSWVRGVLAYARTQIPASKIILGIPLYGYDWAGRHGANLTSQQAVRLAARYHARVRYDSASQSPWFSYTAADGSRHQVWFENPASSRAKLALARAAGAGGVFLWMYGDEAPGTWAALHQVMPVAGQAAPSPGGTP